MDFWRLRRRRVELAYSRCDVVFVSGRGVMGRDEDQHDGMKER